MTTSDLLSRMYAMPLQHLMQEQQTLTQTLRSMPDSQTTGTSALKEPYSIELGQTLASSLDPYIKRTYYLLKSNDGRWLGDVKGSVLSWVDSPDDAQVYNCRRTAVEKHRELKAMGLIACDQVSVKDVDFYAHKSSAHIWSSAYA